jgi:hypothetical protein
MEGTGDLRARAEATGGGTGTARDGCAIGAAMVGATGGMIGGAPVGATCWATCGTIVGAPERAIGGATGAAACACACAVAVAVAGAGGGAGVGVGAGISKTRSSGTSPRRSCQGNTKPGAPNSSPPKFKHSSKAWNSTESSTATAIRLRSLRMGRLSLEPRLAALDDFERPSDQARENTPSSDPHEMSTGSAIGTLRTLARSARCTLHDRHHRLDPIGTRGVGR